MDFKRTLDLGAVLETKSCFLFGPRQSGKSTLIRQQFPTAQYYNLLETDTLATLGSNPSLLRKQNSSIGSLIIIDEFQKLPGLLDEVHAMIESSKTRFLLSGSSSRKLKRTGVNLLGGRARNRNLHPLVFDEMIHHPESGFDLQKVINRGTIPSIYTSDSPEEDLRSYCGTYLQNEIAAEALVRSLPAFGRFLRVAANCDGQLMKYTQIGSDAGVPKSTVIEYFKILEETFIGSELAPYLKTEKRKPIESKKFYFFDCGVARSLRGEGPTEFGTVQSGILFENYIHHELRTFCDYGRAERLNYWRSTSDFEVDFILDEKIAIEVKAKRFLSGRDFKGLQALAEERKMKKFYLVSLTERSYREGEIEVLTVNDFLTRLWAGEL